MRFFTLIKYLFGNRQAIVDVANCRYAVWLGLLFVLSAGFAREYDGEDLRHEPWHLVIPLAASLLTSFLLFLLVEAMLSTREQDPDTPKGFFSKYAAFLGLYWMTAPLAWLYAIPVERFLDAGDAVRCNLWLLGIVSVWRVALMTRVVSVLYAQSALTSFMVVMLFADSVAMVVFWLTPLPILSFMGGIRLTESEQVIRETGFMVRFFGTVSWLVWFFGASYCAVRSKKQSVAEPPVQLTPTEPRTISWALWSLSALSILVWIAILPDTQGEQVNRRRVESDLYAGRIEEAIRYMAERRRDNFPPHWDPPPRFGYGESQPSIIDILLRLETIKAPWVLDLYREKLALQSRADRWDHYSHSIRLADVEDEKLTAYARILETLPEGPAMAVYHQTEIKTDLNADEQAGEGDEADKISDIRRTALKAILSLVPAEKSESAD